MEIREGIKYVTSKGNSGEVSKVYDDHIEVFFSNNRTVVGSYSASRFVEMIKAGMKITYYPYKVGDWVYDIDDELISIRDKIIKISKITNVDIYCIDHDGQESSLPITEFNEYYRPCFEDEIPYLKLPEKWYLVINKDNLDYISKVRVKYFGIINDLNKDTFMYGFIKTDGWYNSSIDDSETEISFEQFRRHFPIEDYVIDDEDDIFLFEMLDKLGIL